MTIVKRTGAFCLSLLLALSLCLAFVPTAHGDFQDVEAAQNSVVRVLASVEIGGDYYVKGHGSGFAVGLEGEPVQYIVTNYHVVEGCMDSMFVTTTDINGAIPAMVLGYNDYVDYAILKLSQPLTDRVPIPLLSPTGLHKGQDVYGIGFPGTSDYHAENDVLSSRVEDMTVTAGTVSNYSYSFVDTQKGSDPVTCVMSDIKLNQGNSGGPLVDEFGQAVGINTTVIGTNQINNMSLAVSMDYITAALDELGIAYITGTDSGGTAAAPQDPAEGGEEPAQEPADGEADQEPVDEAEDQEDEDGEEGGISKAIDKVKELFEEHKILWAVPAVIVIAGAAAVVLLVVKPGKSKSRQPNEPPISPISPISPASPASGTVARVSCISGPIQGQSANGMTVRVGRIQGQCQLVFPDGTPGVSGNHCLVSLSNGSLTVTDYSSNGTFTEGGMGGGASTVAAGAGGMQKLPKGQPATLQNGQIVSLGSEKVQIQVQLAGPNMLRVTCLKGPGGVAGKTVTGSRINVGRRAGQCQLVFPEGTPGISGAHCQIAAVGSSIQIVDSSTYGSFISGAGSAGGGGGLQRLPKGQAVPVQSGQTLYLGSRQVAVRVTLETNNGMGY